MCSAPGFAHQSGEDYTLGHIGLDALIWFVLLREQASHQATANGQEASKKVGVFLLPFEFIGSSGEDAPIWNEFLESLC